MTPISLPSPSLFEGPDLAEGRKLCDRIGAGGSTTVTSFMGIPV